MSTGSELPSIAVLPFRNMSADPELDGNRALQARVTGLIDDPHPALPELGHDLIRPELGTGSEGHGKGRL
jgi:hypothetical protein